MTQAFTNEERRGIAEAFLLAKQRLWTGYSKHDGDRFICHALMHSKHACSHMAEQIVMDRLGGKYTVDCYLQAIGVP